ncbi:unnamed protein product [Rotaria sp. Silwood2]|nr:unnamed protein product [Rotaria sp. Silwood2]CAF4426493.1 unnamed protein product [Rotaria sp. Silwood2]
MIIMNPPLQRVSKRFIIQSLAKESIVRLRQMIIARTGFQLVSFDYSQLELRILVHLFNDSKLKTRLINDTDFFISLAADVLKKTEYEITHEQHQNAKQICYGTLYDMPKETFAHETHMNINEAEEFIKNFYKTFPIMTQFIDDIILISITNGVSYPYLLSSLKQTTINIEQQQQQQEAFIIAYDNKKNQIANTNFNVNKHCALNNNELK